MKKKVPIFKYILDNIDQDTNILKQDFNLNNYKDAVDNYLYYTDGMLDFITPLEVDSQILDFLKNIVINLTNDNIKIQIQKVDAFFDKNPLRPVIGTMKEYNNWLIKQKFDNLLLEKFATAMITTSKKIETVKIGISIIGQLGYKEDSNISDIIKIMSLCEEFTRYCNETFKNLNNCNEIRYEVAELVQGYGKLAVVETLEVENDYQEEWLLTIGCQNIIHNNLLALIVANKIDLPKAINSRKINNQEFLGILDIFDGLFNEEIVPGITEYNKKIELFDSIINLKDTFNNDIRYYALLSNIKFYLLDEYKNDRQLKEINEILSNNMVKNVILKDLENPESVKDDIITFFSIPNNNEFFLEFYKKILALYDKDIDNNLERAIEELDFLLIDIENGDKLLYLIKDKMEYDEEWFGEVLDLYYENNNILVDLVEMLASHPYLGEEYIIKSLNNKAINVRLSGLNTIERWLDKQKGNKKYLPKNINDALFNLKKREPSSVVIEKINDILGIDN